MENTTTSYTLLERFHLVLPSASTSRKYDIRLRNNIYLNTTVSSYNKLLGENLFVLNFCYSSMAQNHFHHLI